MLFFYYLIADKWWRISVVDKGSWVKIPPFRLDGAKNQSESFTKDWINLNVLISTAKKINTVKKIINAKAKGGMSISPKETINKSNKNFIKKQNIVLNIKPINYQNTHHKVDNIKVPNSKR